MPSVAVIENTAKVRGCKFRAEARFHHPALRVEVPRRSTVPPSSRMAAGSSTQKRSSPSSLMADVHADIQNEHHYMLAVTLTSASRRK